MDGVNSKEQTVEEIVAYIRWQDKQLTIPVVVSSATYNASHLWKKATEFTYALEKNGYLACLEDLEKAGIIELKNIDKNH